jgi:microcin C transport system permease protein
LGISLFANFVANDKPIAMWYKGNIYFPAVVNYIPADFGMQGFVVDYFRFEEEFRSNGWALFPPIKQRPYDQNLNFETLPAPPGSTSIISQSEEFEGFKVYHPLGTDTGGRDLLTRLIYGCRTSLLMATAITLISLFLGVVIGSIMGYVGGKLDLFVGRLLETIGYFPVIFLIIILVAFLENPGVLWIISIFSILGCSAFAFYMRGQVLKIRKMTYVEAALALGQSDLKIMFKHILPNAFTPILVLIPFSITGNITFLATIDFLGFGVQPPTASLGSILRSGYDDIANRWWLVAFSSIVLVSILLLVNFIGDGIRDGMDPHAAITKKRIKELEAQRRAEKAALQS